MQNRGLRIVALAVLLFSARAPVTAATPLTSEEAAGHVGETSTVCGFVASAKYATSGRGEPTFLNLDRPYPNQLFTVLIWGSDRDAFGQPEVAYRGKRICVTGLIESYRGKPEIIARRPSQIQLSK